MYKLNTSRLEIASKVFGWKKATENDLLKKIDSTKEEMLQLNDEEFIEILFLYKNDYCEVS
jgi:hypothetical protein